MQMTGGAPKFIIMSVARTHNNWKHFWSQFYIYELGTDIGYRINILNHKQSRNGNYRAM